MKKAKSQEDVILLILVFVIVLSVGVSIFILPRESFSHYENRLLSDIPKISFTSLADGSFFKDLATFYSDNLPLRRQFGYLYSTFELFLGKSESNGIILAKNDILISRSQRSAQIYKQNLSVAENFQNEITLFVIPNSDSIFEDYLPFVASGGLYDYDYSPSGTSLSSRFLSKIHESETPWKYYYRTDHHWTAAGAFEAYTLLCEEWGIPAYDASDFSVQTFCNDFYGSSFRRSALPYSLISPERVELYRYVGDEDLSLTVHGITDKNVKLYDFSAYELPDKYLVHLGGNYAHLSIRNKSVERERLLVIKDSFANALAPFLARHYDVDMVDPRYASPEQIRCLLSKESFSRILVLCSTDTLASERSFLSSLVKK